MRSVVMIALLAIFLLAMGSVIHTQSHGLTETGRSHSEVLSDSAVFSTHGDHEKDSSLCAKCGEDPAGIIISCAVTTCLALFVAIFSWIIHTGVSYQYHLVSHHFPRQILGRCIEKELPFPSFFRLCVIRT